LDVYIIFFLKMVHTNTSSHPGKLVYTGWKSWMLFLSPWGEADKQRWRPDSRCSALVIMTMMTMMMTGGRLKMRKGKCRTVGAGWKKQELNSASKSNCLECGISSQACISARAFTVPQCSLPRCPILHFCVANFSQSSIFFSRIFSVAIHSDDDDNDRQNTSQYRALVRVIHPASRSELCHLVIVKTAEE